MDETTRRFSYKGAKMTDIITLVGGLVLLFSSMILIAIASIVVVAIVLGLIYLFLMALYYLLVCLYWCGIIVLGSLFLGLAKIFRIKI